MPGLSTYRGEMDYSYAPGIFPAMECLMRRPELVRRVLIHSSARGREGAEHLEQLAGKIGVRVEEADRALARISGKENCMAAAVFRKQEEEPIPGENHVVLHHPGDCGNVGTILRTALGFGIRNVCLIRPCADPFDPRTVRASMGSLFGLRMRVFETMEAYQAQAGERMFYPFMLDASVPMEKALPAAGPWSLVFGNEGSGLPASFAGLGQPVRIDSNSEIDSLNLAVAAAIGIYAFTRKEGFCG